MGIRKMVERVEKAFLQRVHIQYPNRKAISVSAAMLRPVPGSSYLRMHLSKTTRMRGKRGYDRR